jgi:hypothetical protein
MPEPGFAQALDYQISGNAAAGRRAVAWALGPGDDLRQLALVFDWCQDLLGETQKRDLAARIQTGMTAADDDDSIAAVRSRVLAAVALFDEVPRTPQRERPDGAGPPGRPRRGGARRCLPSLRAAPRHAG